ncbi:hypothetical protein ACVJMY_005564 [Bradyrhizobium diazoefficiens]
MWSAPSESVACLLPSKGRCRDRTTSFRPLLSVSTHLFWRCRYPWRGAHRGGDCGRLFPVTKAYWNPARARATARGDVEKQAQRFTLAGFCVGEQKSPSSRGGVLIRTATLALYGALVKIAQTSTCHKSWSSPSIRGGMPRGRSSVGRPGRSNAPLLTARPMRESDQPHGAASARHRRARAHGAHLSGPGRRKRPAP